jgi:hypothetical protein
MEETDSRPEQLLLKFRPVGPPASLRGRVLSGEHPGSKSEPTQPRAWADVVFRTAVAAMLTLALGLGVAAERAMTETTVDIGVGPAVWTEQAEEAAEMLDGGTWGRRYITLALVASTRGRYSAMQSGVAQKDTQ